MANSYKSLKEDFVSNLSGGSIGEINTVTAIAPAAYLLWAALQSRHSYFLTSTPPSILADFLLNVGAIVLATTLYASAPGTLLALLIGPSILIFAFPGTKSPPARKTRSSALADDSSKLVATTDQSNTEVNLPIRPFLTAYRGAMMVVTCHSILAVDFPIFPRRFAKVETWGTSLMDVGVGSFVFSSGLVAARGELRRRSLDTNGRANKATLPGFFKSVVSAIRQSLPLFVLGVIRLISVKNLEYAEHVSEYGVHWNFFFTLAMLPLGLCFIQPVLSSLPGPAHGYVGLALTAVYELFLQNTSLKAWALTAPRTDILSKNKEGAVSWIGYLGIFLLGMETGMAALPRSLPKSSIISRLLAKLPTAARLQNESSRSTSGSSSVTNRVQIFVALALSSALYTALLLPFSYPRLFPALSIPISRRLANAPYVLWISAFNNYQLLLFALVEAVGFSDSTNSTPATVATERQAAAFATSRVLGDFNANGLLVFLIANLGTGAVNMGMDTLGAGRGTAMGVLVAYMAAMAVVARLLKTSGIKLKL